MGKITDYLLQLTKDNDANLFAMSEEAVSDIFSGYGKTKALLFLDESIIGKLAEFIKPIFPAGYLYFPFVDERRFLTLIEYFSICIDKMHNDEPNLEKVIQAQLMDLSETKAMPASKDIEKALKQIDKAYLLILTRHSIERVFQEKGELLNTRASEIKFQNMFIPILIGICFEGNARVILNDQKKLFTTLQEFAIKVVKGIASFDLSRQVQKAMASIFSNDNLIQTWMKDEKNGFFTELMKTADSLLLKSTANFSAALFAVENDIMRYKLFNNFLKEKSAEGKYLPLVLSAMLETLLGDEEKFSRFIDLFDNFIQKIVILKLLILLIKSREYSHISELTKNCKINYINFQITIIPYLKGLAEGNKDLIEANLQLEVKDQDDIDEKEFLFENLKKSVEGTFLVDNVRNTALKILAEASNSIGLLKLSFSRKSRELSQQIEIDDLLRIRSTKSTLKILQGFLFHDKKFQSTLDDAIQETSNQRNSQERRKGLKSRGKDLFRTVSGKITFYRRGSKIEVDLPGNDSETAMTTKNKIPENTP